MSNNQLIAITSELDASIAKMDSQKNIASYHHETSENQMANANASSLTAASLLSKQHNTENELRENDATAVDFVNEAIATVIPVSTVVSAMPSPSGTHLLTDVGVANLQTVNPMQRNRNGTKSAISRNQQSSRTAIKSSSASAAPNNNTATQKFHKTDAPMLNYIFDSHLANKHRHYDPRYVYSSVQV